DKSWFKSKSRYNGFDNDLDSKIAWISAEREKYCTAIVISRNIDLILLFNKSWSILHEKLERESIFLLSDVPTMLSKIINANKDERGEVSVMPFVFEKVGTSYNHFLIDEFQDTSNKQWEIFQAMLVEALSQNNRSIIVGDIKQSIYSWRGGDWKILSDLVNKNLLDSFSNLESLGANYRTAENIVHFNNDFFAKEYGGNETTFNSKADKLYIDVAQDAMKKVKSEIEVRIVTRKDKTADKEVIKKEAVFDKMLEKIRILQKEYKVSPSKITILVRKKSEAKYIADQFFALSKDETNDGVCYDVVSNEALYIKSNRAVRLIIAYIRYILNPDDELSKTEAAYLYHLESNKIEDSVKDFDAKAYNEELDKMINGVDDKNAQLVDKQSFEVVDAIIDRLKLNKTKANVPFLISFRNMVHDFSTRTTDLQSFVDYWDERGVDTTLTLPESQNAIKIITVHKSKGLEADYIFVPFCDWSLVSDVGTNYLFVEDKTFSSGDNPVKVPVVISKDLELTSFNADYMKDQLKKRVESFNLLYVAFTRAKYGLYVTASV
ncbi:MAG: UvrD-helicase domain-containing protein, partial [Bacteroidales bacterium]|nr:UvrD-helicase domain-containing protein [Bacteroidales bacterium]